MDGRGGRGGGRNWNDRDDDRKPVNPFDIKNKPHPKENDNKRASRWANSSPKSVVSEEENWDDDDVVEVKNTDENKHDGELPASSKPASSKPVSSKPAVPLLPQTEPIDDDSQEDDFNDFDDSSPIVTTDNRPKIESTDTGPKALETKSTDIYDSEEPQQEQSPPQSDHQSKMLDMFSDDEPVPQSPPKLDQFVAPTPISKDDQNNHPSAEANTTPLYDEPQDSKHESAQNKTNVESTTVVNEKIDESPQTESSNVTIELEQPGIPGVDPITSDC